MDKKRISVILAVLIAAIVFGFIIGVVISNKPSVTGRAVEDKQSIFKESLNIVQNESGVYEWKVKNPGNLKSLKVTGSVSSNGSAKVFVEKNGTKYLMFDSAKQLFDISIQVLPEYKNIKQGEKVLVQIALLNLRGFGSGDVKVKYAIKDSKGNLIAAQEETIFVETQVKFVRELELPNEIKPSTYFAFVDAFSDGTPIGASSDTFEVKSKYEPSYKIPIRYYVMAASALLVIFIVSIATIYGLKLFKKRKKIEELVEKQVMDKIAKLEDELKALEEAHSSKLLSKETYEQRKEKIHHELDKLKK